MAAGEKSVCYQGMNIGQTFPALEQMLNTGDGI